MTNAFPIDIRQATVKDAELLARLGAALFAQAFAHMNSPEDMAAYLPTAFNPIIQTEHLERPGDIFLLAWVRRMPVGYAQLSVSEPPECAAEEVDLEGAIELVRLYVDAAWHGQGVSQALMEEALRRAAEGGHDRIWLGVWEKNARAISFYEKCGFAVIGRKDFLLGADLQTDLVMWRNLRPSSPC